jgi:hypothetical protein
MSLVYRPKGQAVYSTDGLPELTPEIERELADYCAHDTYLCEEIFKRLVQRLPCQRTKADRPHTENVYQPYATT